MSQEITAEELAEWEATAQRDPLCVDRVRLRLIARVRELERVVGRMERTIIDQGKTLLGHEGINATLRSSLAAVTAERDELREGSRKITDMLVSAWSKEHKLVEEIVPALEREVRGLEAELDALKVRYDNEHSEHNNTLSELSIARSRLAKVEIPVADAHPGAADNPNLEQES